MITKENQYSSPTIDGNNLERTIMITIIGDKTEAPDLDQILINNTIDINVKVIADKDMITIIMNQQK